MGKIFIFAGRVHHVERLNAIAELLRLKGHTVTYITADNYLNIDPNTSHLIRSNVPFTHILNYLSANNSNGIASDALSKLGEIADCVDPFYLSGSVREAAECLIGFEHFLIQEKPDLVLGLHENNFWYRILAYCCSVQNIPCACFQEGLLRLRDETTQGKQSISADYSTKLLCWSDAARESYIKAGIPEEKLVVTGISHLDAYLQPYNKQQVKYNLGFDPNRLLASFLLPQISRYDGDWQFQLGTVVEWFGSNGYQLAIKFHPFENEQFVEQVSRSIYKSAKVVTTNVLDLIRASSLVMSQHSTVAIETLALGIPLVEMDLNNFGVLESLSEQGVATLIRSGEMNKLKDILEGKVGIDPVKLVQWKNQNIGPLDGHSTDRVVAELERLL